MPLHSYSSHGQSASDANEWLLNTVLFTSIELVNRKTTKSSNGYHLLCSICARQSKESFLINTHWKTTQDGQSSSGSKVVLARTLTILVEVMDAVRVSNDYLDLIYLGDQLRGTIYKHSDAHTTCFLLLSRYIRQSPHTRRFFVIWMTDGLGSWMRLKTIANFSLCPQSTDSILSPSWRGRVTQLPSNSCPCSFRSCDKRSTPAIIWGDFRWEGSWALNLWNAKTPLLSCWKIRARRMLTTRSPFTSVHDKPSFIVVAEAAGVDRCALLVLVVHRPRMNTCSIEEPMRRSDSLSDLGRETSFDHTTAVREQDFVEYEHRKASQTRKVKKHFDRLLF